MPPTNKSSLPNTFKDDFEKFKNELAKYKFNINFVLGPILLSMDFLILSFKGEKDIILTVFPFFLLVYFSAFTSAIRINTLSEYRKRKKSDTNYKNGLKKMYKLMSLYSLPDYLIFLSSLLFYVVIIFGWGCSFDVLKLVPDFISWLNHAF